ncbi:MAG: TonB-dependent receptor [Bacteroidetes bacterium]|nr:TonB-dependent receptor [Bacteroidota bacterium]
MLNKILFLLLISTNLFSQNFSLNGIITDKENNQPLQNCNIFIPELETGSISNSIGFFEISNIPKGNYDIQCSFVGFKTITKTISINSSLTINFQLTAEDILLNETIVKSSMPKLRETPIAFAEKDNDDLEQTLGSQDVPFLLNSTPSLYVSSQGGGTGDLRLNIRGFAQNNLAIMVNGVPVNNPENGEVYWSNWSGISDVVSSVQAQRGLGANPYTSSAVGGLINIQTYGVGNRQEFLKVRTEFGSDNFRKETISFNKSIIPNNLFITALFSKKDWDGYANQTWLNEYTYYFAVGGIIGNNSLELKIIGSPQEHGQRLTMQSIATWEKRGRRYNSDWGYLNGNPLNLRDNNFHKPTITLNHNWQINENLIMSNVLYYTPGVGGGIIPPWGPPFGVTKEGQVDFDSEWIKNSTTVNSTYSSTLYYTENALRKAVHKHQWFGFLSTLKYNLSNIALTFGIDSKIYSAQNYNTVGNLLGGDYTIWSSDVNKPWNKLLYKGDIVDFNADSFARHFGGFVQSEFTKDNITAYLNLSSSYTTYNRIDYFNYLVTDPRRETGWESFIGFTAKAGINYNLDSKNNTYFNVGYFSKPPLSENVFDYTNNIYDNVKNEKVYNFEIGYGFTDSRLNIKSNIYYTIWIDRSIRNMIQDNTTGEFFYNNILGANARHMGFEFESNYQATKNLLFSGMFSISNNKWTNNVSAVIYPESNPNQQESYNSYVKDLYVGGYPMLLASLSIKYSFNLTSNSELFIMPIYRFSDKQYAQYNSDLRTNPNDAGVNSWKLPQTNIFDINFGINFMLSNLFVKRANVSFHIFNMFNNNNYIIDALDGANHTSNSALVWYGRERWWSVNLALTF